MKKRYLVMSIIFLSLLSIFIGVKEINIFQVDSLDILLLSRIPRLMAIIIAGMGMSICGLIMQSISQNKFVSPSTAGTIDSAKLGILVSMILVPGASILTKSLIAFIFSIIGSLVFMTLLRKIKVKNIILIPLIGIMFGNVIGAITTFLAYRFDLIQVINGWLQGKFSMVIKGNYELLYLTIPLIIVAIFYAKKFTIVGLGKDFSKNLGVNYKLILSIGVVIVSLITVLITIIAGSIPYVGLIVPNIVSIYKGDNLKENIPYTALVGIIFLLCCDIISRVIIYPYELSVSLVVGTLGSLLFLYLIVRGKKYATV